MCRRFHTLKRKKFSPKKHRGMPGTLYHSKALKSQNPGCAGEKRISIALGSIHYKKEKAGL